MRKRGKISPPCFEHFCCNCSYISPHVLMLSNKLQPYLHAQPYLILKTIFLNIFWAATTAAGERTEVAFTQSTYVRCTLPPLLSTHCKKSDKSLQSNTCNPNQQNSLTILILGYKVGVEVCLKKTSFSILH